MTAVVGLLMVVAHFASNPQNWKWLTETAVRKVARNPRKAPPLVNATPDVDELPDDAFRLVPTPEEPPAGVRPVEITPPKGVGGDGTVNLRLSPELLKHVKDSTLGIRRDESPAYYAILAKVHELPVRVLERAGRTDATFAGLFNDPEDYRGQLLTLDGELRRFERIDAGPNDQGLKSLYEGWMFTEDGGRTNPFRIVCTEKPEGMPEGDEVRERVRFTGYFFKRCSYVTPHGLHSTPMLLGHRLRWIRPTRMGSSEHPHLALYVGLVVGTLGAGFASVLWWYSRCDHQAHASQVQRVLEPGNDAFASLKDLQAVDVGEELRQLASAAIEADEAEADEDEAEAAGEQADVETDAEAVEPTHVRDGSALTNPAAVTDSTELDC